MGEDHAAGWGEFRLTVGMDQRVKTRVGAPKTKEKFGRPMVIMRDAVKNLDDGVKAIETNVQLWWIVGEPLIEIASGSSDQKGRKRDVR